MMKKSGRIGIVLFAMSAKLLGSDTGEVNFTQDEALHGALQNLPDYGDLLSDIDHLDADYKKNALETAKTYQKYMNMSRQGIFGSISRRIGRLLRGYRHADLQATQKRHVLHRLPPRRGVIPATVLIAAAIFLVVKRKK